MALSRRFICETAFDIEQARHSFDVEGATAGRHVFVTGLARAGTTVLMRRFHAAGCYRSLTYRDMPFVLAPNLWKRVWSRSPKHMDSRERAHQDGLMVNFDSPEAFEEVFWRTFAAERYIQADALRPMTADDELIGAFRRFIASIIASGWPGQSRYLSKNNNNILRIPAIRRAFPEALIVVPFRDPLQHANSLLKQHRHFTTRHAEDRFARAYMGWLVHYEFGADHRPVILDGRPVQDLSPCRPDRLGYWVDLWTATYRALLEMAPEGLVFVSYEQLCADTDRIWQDLSWRAQIEGATGPEADTLAANVAVIDEDISQERLDAAHVIHDRLLKVAAA